MQTTAQVSLKDAGLHVKSPWLRISFLPLKVLQRATCTGRARPYTVIPSQGSFVCVDEMLFMV